MTHTDDKKRLRELTLGGNWQPRPDWPHIYREMRQNVAHDRFYQETRGCTDEYIEEQERLTDVALSLCPLCERCEQPAYLLRSTGYQRCHPVHLTAPEARAVLMARGFA